MAIQLRFPPTIGHCLIRVEKRKEKQKQGIPSRVKELRGNRLLYGIC